MKVTKKQQNVINRMKKEELWDTWQGAATFSKDRTLVSGRTLAALEAKKLIKRIIIAAPLHNGLCINGKPMCSYSMRWIIA